MSHGEFHKRIFACVGLFGEQTLIIELSWGFVFWLVVIAIGLALESGPPLTWSKNMLRLQLLSKNFERECPMVRLIKLIACFRLLGDHTLIIKLAWKG